MQIKINKPLVGSTHCLEITDVANWTEVSGVIIPGKTCTFSVAYNGNNFTGVAAVSDGDPPRLLLAFDNDCVTLPSESCLEYTCMDAGGGSTGTGKEGPTCSTTKVECADELRLAVLGEDGCLVGYTTLEDIKDMLIDEIKLDDLINCNTVNRGNLVASDRMLALNESDCSLKSISQEDLVCPKNDCP